MYYNDHEPPHFHARYGSQKGRFTIESLQMFEGDLSTRAANLVTEWARLHQEELRREWALARQKKPLFAIEPLK